MLKKIDS